MKSWVQFCDGLGGASGRRESGSGDGTMTEVEGLVGEALLSQEQGVKVGIGGLAVNVARRML